MAWWKDNNIRLVQTNLRQVDVQCDTDRLVGQFIDIGANTVLLNTAGIISFYPSALSYEYVNPYLGDRDFIGDMISKCHAKGLRVICRFDFSKIHKSIFEVHPEWAYVSADGKIIEYNGLVHTCINGEYQDSLSLNIIDEVLNRYHPDGIFFNMFGFITRDYSNVYHGICHCNSCRRKFRQMYGLELPVSENSGTPGLQEYRQFQDSCIRDILKRIYQRVKSHDENIAVCNYAEEYVDIVMNESNTEMHRPYPIWDYMTSENVSRVYSSKDKISGNISINASSIDYRFHGVSPYLIKQRFSQSLASGGQLFWCIIGIFDGYPDRKNFSIVKDYFRLHADNMEYFGRRKNVSDIAIIYPDKNENAAISEFRGIYTVCKEKHILVDVIDRHYISEVDFSSYKVVIVPDLYPDEMLLKQFEISNIRILWIGTAWAASIYKNRIAEFLGIRDEQIHCEDIRWHYISIKDILPNTDWCLVEGDAVAFKKGNNMTLELISDGIFGPPEFCGGNTPEGRYLKSQGTVGTMISFHPGILYHRYGFSEHAEIIYNSIISNLNSLKMETDAPSSVEIAISENKGGQILVFLINHTGFNGRTYADPAVIKSFEVVLNLFGPAHIVKILGDEESLCTGYNYEADFRINIKALKSYMIIILERGCHGKNN